MKQVRIYQKIPKTTQSAYGQRPWLLVPVQHKKNTLDPVMHWVGGQDTAVQNVLKFPTKEQAIRFAQENKYAYQVFEAEENPVTLQSYADVLLEQCD